MTAKKIMLVFGTRPEAIKMAPLVAQLKDNRSFDLKVCVTAQHREMLDMVLQLFSIQADYDLNLMKARQTITGLTTAVLQGIEPVLEAEKPDLVLVHGDTTTTFAAALAAFYQQLPVGHVEAGLRSGNIYSPYPEEMNRTLVSSIARLHFAPTVGNRDNLIRSGVDPSMISVTGNTVIDALHSVVRDDYVFNHPLLDDLDHQSSEIILLTAHRRENWGSRMHGLFLAIRRLIDDHPRTVLVFPVHRNPVVREEAEAVLGRHPRIHLIEPLDYQPFANLIARSHLVLTDSGGIQEEAPALGKPVLVLRTETERPEAVAAGTVLMAGVDPGRVYDLAALLLNDRGEYNKMAHAVNPYGDGTAAQQIVGVMEKHFALA